MFLSADFDFSLLMFNKTSFVWCDVKECYKWKFMGSNSCVFKLYFQVWYDYEYQLVRYDINDVVPTSTIQDFNAG